MLATAAPLSAFICAAIYQILLDSRKIYRRSRGRLRSMKIFFLVAACRAVKICGEMLFPGSCSFA